MSTVGNRQAGNEQRIIFADQGGCTTASPRCRQYERIEGSEQSLIPVFPTHCVTGFTVPESGTKLLGKLGVARQSSGERCNTIDFINGARPGRPIAQGALIQVFRDCRVPRERAQTFVGTLYGNQFNRWGGQRGDIGLRQELCVPERHCGNHEYHPKRNGQRPPLVG